MNIRRQTLKKAERLCGVKAIEELFEKGSQFHTICFRVIWNVNKEEEGSPPAKIVLSVTKKSFRKAVIRNLVRRRIREAYRKNKQDLYKFLLDKKLSIVIMLIFRKNEIPDYATVEQDIKHVFSRLTSLIKERDIKC